MTLLPQAGRPLSPVETPSTTIPDLAQQLQEAAILDRKKKEWAAWANNEYNKCKNARVPHERQWYLNLAFNSGRQYVVPFESLLGGTRLTVPRVPPHRVRLVVNLVRKAVQKECAKLTMSKPVPTVMPATNETDDITAANVSEQILKSVFGYSEFQEEYYHWIWWGVVCGKSFFKSYFDPRAKDYSNMALPKRPTMADGSPVPDSFIAAVPELKKELETPVPSQGKICMEALSPFHVYVPDLMVTSLEKQPYLIEVRTKHPEWVKKTYGFTPTTDTRAQASIMETAFLLTRTSEEHLDAVIVKEVWIKPNFHPDFPEGGWLVVINDKVVDYRDKWWLPFPEFPYYEYNGLPTGTFYTDSRIVDEIPIQKEYNKKRSQAIEIQNVMGKPKFFYQEGSVNVRKMSSEPGQGVPYKAGYMPPTQINGIEVPNSFVNEITQLRNEFDDISGQHEISNGDTPSGVTSGTAISYLQEQDDTSLAYQVSSIERAIQNLGTHYLKYVTTFWTDDRIIRIAGRNNTYESIHWKKSAAEGNTDVKVQTGSALPFSKAAKQALITEMMQMGFLSPEVGLEILDMGTFDKAMEEYLVDKRQATRENIKHQDLPDSVIETLMQMPPEVEAAGGIDPNTGRPWGPQPVVPVNSWDNHEAHVMWHDMYRKSQEFEGLSVMQKQAMELHVQAHRMAMMSAMVNQAGMPLNDVAAGQQEAQQFDEQDQQQQGIANSQKDRELGIKEQQVQNQHEQAQASRAASSGQSG